MRMFILVSCFRHRPEHASKKQTEKLRGLFDEKAAFDQRKYFSDSDYYTMNHLPLPHWVTYIAWAIAILAVLSSAFFLILYSMQWGIPKSEEWLTTFVLSFFESLIMVDPVKVSI